MRVVAGEAFGVISVIGAQTPIWLQDWQVAPGASAEVKIDSDFNVAAYVFEGTVCFGADKTAAEQGQLAVMGLGINLQVHASPGNGRGRLPDGQNGQDQPRLKRRCDSRNSAEATATVTFKTILAHNSASLLGFLENDPQHVIPEVKQSGTQFSHSAPRPN